MAYFTRTYLAESLTRRTTVAASESFAANLIELQTRALRENVERREQIEDSGPVERPRALFDIFLSHSSIDHYAVNLVYLELTRRGYTVYLDRIVDPQLNPSQVNRATAEVLRRRMAQCRSLFVATSENVKVSPWVPWELGFADGWNGKAAVLPILDTEADWFGRSSYFELYPEVQRSTSSATKPNDLDIVDIRKWSKPWGRWINEHRLI